MKISSPAMNTLRRPNRSAARPPRISSPPNEIAYAVTIHWTDDAEKPSSASMDGSATFTMLKSSTTMNDAARIRASASPRRPAGSASPAALSVILAAPAALCVTRADFGVPCDVLLFDVAVDIQHLFDTVRFVSLL